MSNFPLQELEVDLKLTRTFVHVLNARTATGELSLSKKQQLSGPEKLLHDSMLIV